MKLSSPAVERNRDAIAAVLAGWLPASGLVLEVASGTGEHAIYFSRAFPDLRWQPSDADADARRSIDAWREEAGADNLRSALAVDASAPTWPVARADAVLCVNMVHISPWGATLGLIDGAARLLPDAGPLILYGPFLQADVPIAPSNLAFDASLKARSPDWGLRSVERVRDAAASAFALDEVVAMPANNLMLLFRKRAALT